MSIPFSNILVKHHMRISDSLVSEINRGGNFLYNGTFYLLTPDKTFHYRAVSTGDFSFYNQYIKDSKDEESHSEEKFRNLIKNFDLKKMGKISVNCYDHTNNYWVQDGNHRLAILFHLKPFGGNFLPLEYVDITYYPCVEDKMKTALMNTTNQPHYNGWSNRTQFGYHSFDIYNLHIPGQRNPSKRLEKLKRIGGCSFVGAKVLDLGCNTGGMLLHLPEIQQGIGIDFDKNCIDACEVFKYYMNYSWNLRFFVHDLNSFSVEDFCISNKFMPDYIFLLSLGSWVKNWKALYESAYDCSKKIVLEINNVKEGVAQLKLFESLGAKITLVSDNSDDDSTGNNGRQIYLVEKPE